MANNRLYLKCSVCGETVFLAKSFSAGYYQAVYSPEEQHRRLEEFYDKHAYCNGSDSDGLFELEYEDPPDGFAKVVRCKDCKHHNETWCDMNSRDRGEWFNWYDDDFCSYGERRNDE